MTDFLHLFLNYRFSVDYFKHDPISASLELGVRLALFIVPIVAIIFLRSKNTQIKQGASLVLVLTGLMVALILAAFLWVVWLVILATHHS